MQKQEAKDKLGREQVFLFSAVKVTPPVPNTAQSLRVSINQLHVWSLAYLSL